MSETDLVQAAGEKLRQEIALDRLHTRGTGSLPFDPERARLELMEGERARRSSRPKSRRWRGLAKLDDKIDELTLRLEDGRQERHRAEERVQRAPEDDARSLAAWIAGASEASARRRRCTSANASVTPPSSPSKRSSGRWTRRSRSVFGTWSGTARRCSPTRGKTWRPPGLVCSPTCRGCRRCARSSSTPATSSAGPPPTPNPQAFSEAFQRHAAAAGLPKIPLHGLRHTHATIALQAGIHPKVVSDRLGHYSAAFTLDTYSESIPALQETAAATVAALVRGAR